MNLRLGKVAEIIQADGSFNPELTACGYSIDSRTIKPGELFFAIRGERFDGNDFADLAIKQGAVAAVVAPSPALPLPHSFLVVANPLAALQTLAAAVRRRWGKLVIAVTGSAGKTTTKEMIAGALGTRYKVLKSEGNLNNHFGVPLQLLRLEPEHELAVMELGMNHAGEITALARMAAPNVGVVTNVGPVHLEFFHSVAEIAAAKKELIDALPAEGVAILNADDEYVSQFGRDFRGRVITFGMKHEAEVRAENLEERGLVGSSFSASVGGKQCPVHLAVPGLHNVYNALAAISVAMEFQVPLDTAALALARFRPVNSRGEIIEIGDVMVVNDCYNSNPRALNAMVDALALTPANGGRRVVVAGEMLELGAAGEELHRECGRHMAGKSIDVVLGVRGLARYIIQGACEADARLAQFFETPEQAGEWLARETHAGDVVLLKGSRGVQLERALASWKRHFNMSDRSGQSDQSDWSSAYC